MGLKVEVFRLFLIGLISLIGPIGLIKKTASRHPDVKKTNNYQLPLLRG
jgi:hypothetical protein